MVVLTMGDLDCVWLGLLSDPAGVLGNFNLFLISLLVLLSFLVYTVQYVGL